MQSEVHKPFLCLDSIPILFHALSRVQAVKGCEGIILAVHPGALEKVKEQYGAFLKNSLKVIRIISGGDTRQQTVMKMLKNAPGNAEVILIHDGARPLLRPAMAGEIVDAATRCSGGAIAAVPSAETIKVVNRRNIITSTPQRDKLWMAQTPQVFWSKALINAYERAEKATRIATDDAEVVEKSGFKVAVRMGNRDNIKITTPADLEIAETILKYQRKEGVEGCEMLASLEKGLDS